MDTWDWILLAWWGGVAVTLAVTVVMFRRGSRIGRREAFRASLQPNAVGRYGGFRMSETSLPAPLTVIYVLLWIALAIGAVALLYGGYANPRTMANLFGFVILFGLILLSTGVSSSILPEATNKWIKRHAVWLRLVAALTGLGMIAYAGITLFEDFTRPHTIVEGRITRLTSDYGPRRAPAYWAYIGGHPFMITHDVQSQLAVGQWVRAERTAGSDVIVQAAATAPPTRPAH